MTRHLAAEARAVLNLVLFAAFGFGAQWLFGKVTGSARRHLGALPMEIVKDRLRVIAARFALAFGAIAAFVVGCLGPLPALDWDPARRDIALGFLIVFVATEIAGRHRRFAVAPEDERFRIIPTDSAAARFWCRRLTAFAGWFVFVWVIIQECDALGFTFEGLQLVGYTLGLDAVAIALEAVWRRPATSREVDEAASAETHRFGQGAANIAASIGIVVMWGCWIAAPSVMSVLPAFWLVLYSSSLRPPSPRVGARSNICSDPPVRPRLAVRPASSK